MDQKKVSFTGDGNSLLCKSQPGSVKSVYRTYAIIALLVVVVQAIVFWQRIFMPLQIALFAAFLIAILYAVWRTVRESKDWLNLYETYFETSEGRFSYREIKDIRIMKGQITLEMKRRHTFYVSNEEELRQILRKKRFENNR